MAGAASAQFRVATGEMLSMRGMSDFTLEYRALGSGWIVTITATGDLVYTLQGPQSSIL